MAVRWFEGIVDSWKHQADSEAVELMTKAVAALTPSFWPLCMPLSKNQVR
jgi:hypothetical protein